MPPVTLFQIHNGVTVSNKSRTTRFFSESQGILADYNLLVDKLNTDTDRADVEAEAAELKAANDAESKEVETLFAEKQV